MYQAGLIISHHPAAVELKRSSRCDEQRWLRHSRRRMRREREGPGITSGVGRFPSNPREHSGRGSRARIDALFNIHSLAFHLKEHIYLLFYMKQGGEKLNPTRLVSKLRTMKATSFSALCAFRGTNAVEIQSQKHKIKSASLKCIQQSP